MVAVPRDAEAWLKREAPRLPIVMLFGPDEGLVSARAKALVAARGADPDDPFALVRLGPEALAEPGRLADEAGTLGLFGTGRTVWLRGAGVGRGLDKAVETLLAGPPPAGGIVIEAGDLKKGASARTLLERSPHGAAVPCYADGPREVARVVDDTLRERGFHLGADARAALLAVLGADRRLTLAELDKLMTYLGEERRVTVAHVAAVVSDAAPPGLDAALDGAYAGEAGVAARELTRALADGLDPGASARAMLRHALGLLAVRLKRDGGAGEDEAMERSGVFWRRRPAVARLLPRWSAAALEARVIALGAVELEVRRRPALAEAILTETLLEVARGRR